MTGWFLDLVAGYMTGWFLDLVAGYMTGWFLDLVTGYMAGWFLDLVAGYMAGVWRFKPNQTKWDMVEFPFKPKHVRLEGQTKPNRTGG
jgi:hypothetical protein